MKPQAKAKLVLMIAGLVAATVSAEAAPTKPAPSETQLRRAAVVAIRGNWEASNTDLWTNRIPAGASASTGGPALAAMQASANKREREGLRVRVARGRLEVLKIVFGHGDATATALVKSDQTLVPSHADGQRLGRQTKLRERARLLLRRLGRSDRFVVWEVDVLP